MLSLKKGPKDNSRKHGDAAAHKDALKAEALTRQAEYDKLTTEQKIAKLDAGGYVAKKQRAKLAAPKTTEKKVKGKK